MEPHISTILRNILEDHATLKAWMETEIRSMLTFRHRPRDMYSIRHLRESMHRKVPMANFLGLMNPIIQREPLVFMEAVAEVCALEDGATGEDKVVTLKRGKDTGADNAAAAPAADSGRLRSWCRGYGGCSCHL
jgi:hypothetical protein